MRVQVSYDAYAVHPFNYQDTFGDSDESPLEAHRQSTTTTDDDDVVTEDDASDSHCNILDTVFGCDNVDDGELKATLSYTRFRISFPYYNCCNCHSYRNYQSASVTLSDRC